MSQDKPMSLSEIISPRKKATRKYNRTGTKVSPSFRGDFTSTIMPRAAKAEGLNYKKLIAPKAPKTKLDYLRGQREVVSNNEVFDDLINIILNAKKDITRINGLDDIENARKYAETHGYRIPDELDINHDGVDDIIISDKKGRPVIVNGYKISDSRQPIRKMYIKEKRAGKADNYSQFVRNLYEADEYFNEDGEREVKYDNNNLPDSLRELKDAGWRIPTAPKRKQSIYQMIMNAIRNIYNGFVDQELRGRDKEYINGILPRFKLLSIVYIAVIDAHIWTTLLPENVKSQIRERVDELNANESYGGDEISIYDGFKAWKESNRKLYNSTLMDSWEDIKGIDFSDSIGNALDSIGCTIALLDNDDQFPTRATVREATINSEADEEAAAFVNEHKDKMKSFKLQWNSAAERAKNNLIGEVFV